MPRTVLKFTVAICAVMHLAVAANGQVKLEQKLTPGTKFKVRETAKVSQTLTLAGQELVTAGDTSTTTRVEYGKANDSGAIPVTTTYEALVAELKLPGGLDLKFDSANPDAKAENEVLEILLDRFRAITKLKLTVFVDPEGNVVDVEGITPGSGLDREELKIAHQQEHARIPAKPLKEGDTWQATEQQFLGEGQVFKVDRQYNYTGTVEQGGRKLHKIEATDKNVEFSIKPNSGIPGKVTKSDLKIESAKHTYLFDQQLGRVVSAESDIQINGKIALSIMNMDFDGDLDLTMNIQNEEVE